MDLTDLTDTQRRQLAMLYRTLAKCIDGWMASRSHTDKEFWSHQIDQAEWDIQSILRGE